MTISDVKASYNPFPFTGGANCESVAAGVLSYAGASADQLRQLSQSLPFGVLAPYINFPYDVTKSVQSGMKNYAALNGVSLSRVGDPNGRLHMVQYDPNGVAALLTPAQHGYHWNIIYFGR